MPRDRGQDRYVSNVLVSFVATYRPTLEFFANKEAAMAEYYPEPFPHWVRGERHFNLVSRDTRRVVRFEPGRFIVRAEGHPTTKPYDEVIAIAARLLDIFNARDLFGALFTLVRVHELPTRKEARTRFAKMFLSGLSEEILPFDGATDYAVTLERNSTVSSELIEMKPALAPLRLKTNIATGPVEYREIGQRYCEFTANADNELYKTEHVAPDFGIVAAVNVTLDRYKAKEGVPVPLLWKFHEWARAEAEAAWSKIERTL